MRLQSNSFFTLCVEATFSLIFAFILGTFLSTSAGSHEPAPASPGTLLKADSVHVDHELSLIIARGQVQVYGKDRILKADTVSYNRITKRLTASGHVELFEPSGDVLSANYIELSDDLRDGFLKGLGAVLTDDSRLAAVSGVRIGGHTTQLNKAVYSPCALCKADPERPPLWQIKSETILWDEIEKEISYTDATFEMWGVPVFYTPYLSHPDPSVHQKSGLISPTVGSSSSLGFILSSPYYFALAPYHDLTLSPLVTTKGGIFMGSQYRRRFQSGEINLDGSIGRSRRIIETSTERRTEKPRWHINSGAKFDLSKHWRTKIKLQRASDQTYLRQYPYYGVDSVNTLISQGVAEGFYGQNYLRFRSFWFQGLRESDRDKKTPYILPLMEGSYISKPLGPWGLRWTLNGNTLVLGRQKGTQVRRASLDSGAHIPYLSPFGDVYTFGINLRTDLYHVHQPTLDKFHQSRVAGFTGRVFPQGYINWRYPFINNQTAYQLLLEPCLSFITGPNVGAQHRIPNEDSPILEPDDHSFMDRNRFPGLDRLDGGTRLNYGLKFSTTLKSGGTGYMFFGQSHSFSEPSSTLNTTGLDRKWSDYFGHIGLTFTPYADLRYRFRLDRNSLEPNRSELVGRFGTPLFNVTVDYISLPKFIGEEKGQSGKQAQVELQSNFIKSWTARIGTTRDLGKGGGALSEHAGLLYQDECFGLDMSFTKTHYEDRDLKPETILMFRLIFKNLGEGRVPLPLS